MNQPASRPQWTSAFSVPLTPPTLLLVDDDRIVRAMLQEALTRQGYAVLTAQDGREALELLARHGGEIQTVILDREMSGMSGMEVIPHIKSNPQFCTVPIIMLTGSGSQEDIQEGIDAGVYYYLVKPVDNGLLRSVIGSALRERGQKAALLSEISRQGSALKAMQSCRLYVRSLREAEDTACLLAACFPDPERVVSGLMELLVNAVEHGNLGISYEEKQSLLADGRWAEEIERRLGLAEHSGRRVEVSYQRKDDACLVQITDAGEGFDWKRYWHINPARAMAGHGRGIARARAMAFDQLSYNEKGNSVTAMVASQKKDDYAW